jgi:hypothetical protein
MDLSGFLDTAYGFVPLVMPITEPAVALRWRHGFR